MFIKTIINDLRKVKRIIYQGIIYQRIIYQLYIKELYINYISKNYISKFVSVFLDVAKFADFR